MNTFDIGYIPKGWTKGEPLRFDEMGAIWQEEKIGKMEAVIVNNVACLTCRNVTQDKLKAWLEWWYK